MEKEGVGYMGTFRIDFEDRADSVVMCQMWEGMRTWSCRQLRWGEGM